MDNILLALSKKDPIFAKNKCEYKEILSKDNLLYKYITALYNNLQSITIDDIKQFVYLIEERAGIMDLKNAKL